MSVFFVLGISYNRKDGYITLIRQIYCFVFFFFIVTLLCYNYNKYFLSLEIIKKNFYFLHQYLPFIFISIICSVSFLLFVRFEILYEKDKLIYNNSEYFFLILLSILGLLLLCSTNELFTAHISLELISVSLYLMVSFKKKHTSLLRNRDLKYFIIGLLSTGFFLYGFSFIHGCFNDFNFEDLRIFLRSIKEIIDRRLTIPSIKRTYLENDYYYRLTVTLFGYLYYPLTQEVYLPIFDKYVSVENYLNLLHILDELEADGELFFSTGIFQTSIVFDTLSRSDTEDLLDWYLKNHADDDPNLEEISLLKEWTATPHPWELDPRCTRIDALKHFSFYPSRFDSATLIDNTMWLPSVSERGGTNSVTPIVAGKLNVYFNPFPDPNEWRPKLSELYFDTSCPEGMYLHKLSCLRDKYFHNTFDLPNAGICKLITLINIESVLIGLAIIIISLFIKFVLALFYLLVLLRLLWKGSR